MSGWSRPVLKRLLLPLGSLIVALALCEVALRFSGIVRNVGPAYLEYDPDYHWKLKASFQCTRTTPEFSFKISTNRLGLRGPDPGTNYRGGVIFLGDSFTMGYGVDDGEEFARLIGRALEQQLGYAVPTHNFGIESHGQAPWLRQLTDLAPALEPRLIVMQMCSNDWSENTSQRMFRLEDSGTLTALTAPPKSTRTQVREAVEQIPGVPQSYLYCFAKQLTGRNRRGSGGDPLPSTERNAYTSAFLEQCLAICLENGWPVVVTTAWVQGEQLQFLEEFCRQHELPLVVTPTQPERPDLFYEVDGHWNAEGHRDTANRLLPVLVEILRG